MALPTKVVDQLSRAPARTPGWSGRVLLFSATFFILSLAVFLGIKYGYGPFLRNQITGLDREIDEFTRQVPAGQQDEFISFYSQLDNMSVLLDRQTMTSKVFGWLEENTNVNVQLLTLSFNNTNKTIMIAGVANSIISLGEQLNRFKNQPAVKSSQLSQLSLDQKSGGWTFDITLTMKPEFFVSSLTASGAIVSSTEPAPTFNDNSETLPTASSTESPTE